MGFRKVGDDDFVKSMWRGRSPARPPVAANFVVRSTGPFRLDQFAEDRPSGLKFMLQAKHRACDHPRLRPCEAHNPDAATARGRGDSHDCVVQIHGEDCNGWDIAFRDALLRTGTRGVFRIKCVSQLSMESLVPRNDGAREEFGDRAWQWTCSPLWSPPRTAAGPHPRFPCANPPHPART